MAIIHWSRGLIMINYMDQGVNVTDEVDSSRLTSRPKCEINRYLNRGKLNVEIKLNQFFLQVTSVALLTVRILASRQCNIAECTTNGKRLLKYLYLVPI